MEFLYVMLFYHFLKISSKCSHSLMLITSRFGLPVCLLLILLFFRQWLMSLCWQKMIVWYIFHLHIATSVTFFKIRFSINIFCSQGKKILLGIVEIGKQIRHAPNRNRINTNRIALQSFRNLILDISLEY